MPRRPKCGKSARRSAYNLRRDSDRSDSVLSWFDEICTDQCPMVKPLSRSDLKFRRPVCSVDPPTLQDPLVRRGVCTAELSPSVQQSRARPSCRVPVAENGLGFLRPGRVENQNKPSVVSRIPCLVTTDSRRLVKRDPLKSRTLGT